MQVSRYFGIRARFPVVVPESRRKMPSIKHDGSAFGFERDDQPEPRAKIPSACLHQNFADARPTGRLDGKVIVPNRIRRLRER